MANNGAVVWSGFSDSFGNYQETELDIGGIDNPLRFPGQYADTETGLHYNYFRYYDPKIGRYLRVDPIGIDSRNANLYEYVQNNPLRFRDPRGLLLIDFGWGEQEPSEEEQTWNKLDRDRDYSFSAHAVRFMLMQYIYGRDTQVGKKVLDPNSTVYNPNYVGWRWTDCITYVHQAIRYGYNMTGQHRKAERVRNNAASGIHLARLLRTLGWKVIYWNPDVNHPSDHNTEHLESWKNYHEKHQYGGVIIDKNGKEKFVGVEIDALVINYKPTPEDLPGYDKWCNGKYAPYVTCCPTKKDMSGYNKLEKVKFGVVIVRGAAHNFLYSEGKTYEVHYDQEPGPSLFEQKDFLEYDWIADWRDGIIVVPPDNGEF